jgi:hypothetical protein
MSTFQAGVEAKKSGKTENDNPYIIGKTKLGANRLSEEGIEWQSGFNSVGRVASKEEMNAARLVDVSRFRRKSNRYYS